MFYNIKNSRTHTLLLNMTSVTFDKDSFTFTFHSTDFHCNYTPDYQQFKKIYWIQLQKDLRKPSKEEYILLNTSDCDQVTLYIYRAKFAEMFANVLDILISHYDGDDDNDDDDDNDNDNTNKIIQKPDNPFTREYEFSEVSPVLKNFMIKHYSDSIPNKVSRLSANHTTINYAKTNGLTNVWHPNLIALDDTLKTLFNTSQDKITYSQIQTMLSIHFPPKYVPLQ